MFEGWYVYLSELEKLNCISSFGEKEDKKVLFVAFCTKKKRVLH